LRFWIEHETRLEFTQPVYEHHCEVRLSPRVDPFHRIFSVDLHIDPPASLFNYTDAFGNTVQSFDILKPHQVLVTRLRSEVETTQTNPFDVAFMTPEQEIAWYEQRLKENPLLWQYVLHRSEAVSDWSSLEVANLKPPIRDPQKSVFDSVMQAVQWTGSILQYQYGISHTHSSLHDILSQRKGVCQDFSHLLIALIRSWKIPARYVMGYMEGSVSTHAWVDVLIPGAGWRGFDATNQLCVNDLYIPVAIGRDYLDAAPQRGTFKGNAVQQSQKIHVNLQQQPFKPPLDPAQQQQTVQ